MTDDAALLASYAQTRDAEAFRVLVDRHAPLVFGTCLRVCGNRADADDAVQEVFIALARAAARIQGHLPAWLHQVSLRIAMHLRRKRRGRQLDPTLAAGEPDEVRTLLPQLDRAIAGLPDEERRCVMARYLEGRSQQEIAAELGLSQPTVHRRLEAAVERLRSALGANGNHCVAALALAVMPVPTAVQAALGKVALVGPAPATAAAGGGTGAGLVTTLVAAGALGAGVVASVAFLRSEPATRRPQPVAAPVTAMVSTAVSPLPIGAWAAITPPVRFTGNPAGVLGIAIDPQRPATLYVGIEAKIGGDHADGCGLWRSLDGGASWALLGTADPDTSDDRSTALDMPIAVTVDPQDSRHLYATEGVRGNNQGFWFSTDGGASWTRTFRGSLSTLAVDPTDFRHLLVGSHLGDGDRGVLESHDGGRTWTTHRPSLVPGRFAGSHSPAFLCDPATKQGDGNTWLVQQDGLWRTTDAGATWQQVSDDPGHNGLTDGAGLCYGPSGRLYRVAAGRVLRSSDNGVTWEDLSSAVPHSTYYSIASDGRALWLMPDGHPPENTWMSTPDNGSLTWTAHRGGGQAQRGPLTLRFDPRNRILYSANWSAGLWALRMP